jgi:hypothetical protein
MLYQLVILIFLLSGIFPYEKQTNMTKLLFSCAGGRKKLWRRKGAAAAWFATILWATASILQCAQVLRSGGSFAGLFEPAATLSWFSQVPSQIPLAAVLAGIFLLRLLLLLSVTGIILFVSFHSKNLPMALCINAVILLLPACIDYLTGYSGLILSAMEGLQLLYDRGATGGILLGIYALVGLCGYALTLAIVPPPTTRSPS